MQNMKGSLKKVKLTLRENCPYSEFLWSSFSLRMWENTNQEDSENRQFSHSVNLRQVRKFETNF